LLLYHHLINRGCEQETTPSLILEACCIIQYKAQSPAAPPAQPSTASLDGKKQNRLFIHLKYHPDNIPSRQVQELYQEHCGELLNRELGIEQPTIAYSRPKNLCNLKTKAKLHQQAPGKSSSIILEELRLDWLHLNSPQIFYHWLTQLRLH
jgi:hypothetical protein